MRNERNEKMKEKIFRREKNKKEKQKANKQERKKESKDETNRIYSFFSQFPLSLWREGTHLFQTFEMCSPLTYHWM